MLLCLWSCWQLQVWPENDVSMWVRNLFGDSNFFGFQGSWVERDFTQLVTAVFQGICEANPDWKCVGLQLLRPVLHWRNVDSSNFSKLTDNTENGQRNSPLPSAPIRTTDSNRRCGGVRWPVHVPGWWKLTLTWTMVMLTRSGQQTNSCWRREA